MSFTAPQQPKTVVLLHFLHCTVMQTEEKVRVIVDVSGALCQEELDNSKQKKTVTSLIQPLPLPT